MNKPHKHAEVIKAWADGAEIECRCPVNNSGWLPTNAPSWFEDYEYRVKPQPKKYKVDVWLVFRKDGTFITDFTSQPDVAILPSSNYHVIHHTLEGELPNDDIELAVWNSGGFEFIRLLTEYPIEVEQ